MNNSELKLTYGSIIQIKNNLNEYKDDLFFVNYVSEKKLILKKNITLELITFNLQDDKDINEINILLYSQDGYAKINNLTLNTIIKVKFNNDDNDEFIGQIIDVENDMITVRSIDNENNENSDIIYINFHYCGLDERIKEIQILPIEAKRLLINGTSTQEEDDEEEEVLSYNLDQQIDNYTEKMINNFKNEKYLKKEINRYLELLHLYVNLEYSQKIIRLSKFNNQIKDNIFLLKNDLVTPVSSYIKKDLYISKIGGISIDDINSNDYVELLVGNEDEELTNKYSIILNEETEINNEIKDIVM